MKKLLYPIVAFIFRLSRNWIKNYTGIDNNQRKKDRAKEVNGLKVTEHAIIRYFERVEGYNINEIRNKLTGGNLAALSKANKGTQNKYIIGDLVIVVEGEYVLTVYKNDNHLQNNIRGFKKLGLNV